MTRRSTGTRSVTFGLACVFGFVVLLNQTPSTRGQLVFDAASIKENRDVERGRLSVTATGLVSARHMTPAALIAFAFDLQHFQLAGVPDWLNRTFYDIVARPASNVTRAQAREMLRSLLVERFKLRFHRETRPLEGFALVRSGSGPGLKPSNVNCEVAVSDAPECRDGGVGEGSVKMFGAYVSSLIAILLTEVNAPIQDRTMLTGNLDIDLQWSRDPAGSVDHPALYTALREQLGVKLEPQRVPTEVLVIDSIARPSAD